MGSDTKEPLTSGSAPHDATVPFGLVSMLATVAFADERGTLFAAAARALFAYTAAREVLVSLPDTPSASGGQPAYRVVADYRDGDATNHATGVLAPSDSITMRVAQSGETALLMLDAPAKASESTELPVRLGLPIIWEAYSSDPIGVLGLGFDAGCAPDADEMLYCKIVAHALAGNFARSMDLRDSLQAGRAVDREYMLQRLHDSAIQDIFACQMSLSVLLDTEDLSSKARQGITDALVDAQEANRSLRRILSERSVSAPQHSWSLQTLVDFELAYNRAHADLRVHSMVTGDIALSGRLADVCSLVVREALCNARKHARAHDVIVFGALENGTLLLSIEDDGIGFDPDNLMLGPDADGSGLHFGLANLYRTAASIGGTFDIESAPGEGTIVRLRVPYTKEGRIPWIL